MKKVRKLPSVELLNDLFEYEEGRLLYKKSGKGKVVKGKEAGCIAPDGYRQVRIAGQLYQAHRLVWKMIKGEDPKQFIDHINHDRADNRIENLRDVCNALNCFNSKTKGAWFKKDKSKWLASLQFLGKRHHLGYFDTEEEASEVLFAFKTAYAYVG